MPVLLPRHPLVYENFESYSNSGNMYVNWTTAGEGNPYLTPYLDTAFKYEGSKSMRLDSPLYDVGLMTSAILLFLTRIGALYSVMTVQQQTSMPTIF